VRLIFYTDRGAGYKNKTFDADAGGLMGRLGITKMHALPYLRAFLEPFGADIGQAILWEDVTGTRIPISDLYFRDRSGVWKIGKRGRDVYLPLLAEAILDPDEIWLGLVEKNGELVLDRRYIRVDPERGMMVVLELGRRWWEERTAFSPGRGGNPSLSGLDARRGGKLLWKRK
jgi:hypothetical protein